MQELLYEVKDGVGTITLNRPAKMNAFTPNMIELWHNALTDARHDPNVHVVVVTGAGRGFCAGADLSTLGNQDAAFTFKDYLWEHILRIALLIEDMDKPVIAAMNGTAVGAGLDMALMCDMRFAAEGARFTEGYVKVGLMPGDGGTYFLPRLVGLAKALELMWSGDVIDAHEACRIGMVNRVVPADQLMAVTYQFAQQLVNGPTRAIRLIKRAAHQSMRMDMRTSLDMVSSHMGLLHQTEDHKEGVQAMKEKRPPHFTGR